MLIQSIPVTTTATSESKAVPTGITMVEVLGPVDPANMVIVRARELVLKTGSRAMISSFDSSTSEENLALGK